MRDPVQTASQQDPEIHAPGRSLASIVGELDAWLRTRLGPGDVAALRRIRPTDPFVPAFWKLVVGVLEPAGALAADGQRRESQEARWAGLLQCMAVAKGLHQPKRRFGEALAAAGLSELRLMRLLRARGDALQDAVRVIASFLASKAEPSDWTEVARLLLAQDGDVGERARRRIARDFYAAAERR